MLMGKELGEGGEFVLSSVTHAATAVTDEHRRDAPTRILLPAHTCK